MRSTFKKIGLYAVLMLMIYRLIINFISGNYDVALIFSWLGLLILDKFGSDKE